MSMTGNIGFSMMVVFVTIIERGSQSRSFSSRMSAAGSAQKPGPPAAARTRTSGRTVLVIIAGISGKRFDSSQVAQPGVAAAGLDAGEPAAGRIQDQQEAEPDAV